MILKDFRGLKIILSMQTIKKIEIDHPEISLKNIETALLDPMEVRESIYKKKSELYYRCAVKKGRFICVVVKFNTPDGNNYIETAYTSSKLKKGKIIYSKKRKEK